MTSLAYNLSVTSIVKAHENFVANHLFVFITLTILTNVQAQKGIFIVSNYSTHKEGSKLEIQLLKQQKWVTIMEYFISIQVQHHQNSCT